MVESCPKGHAPQSFQWKICSHCYWIRKRAQKKDKTERLERKRLRKLAKHPASPTHVHIGNSCAYIGYSLKALHEGKLGLAISHTRKGWISFTLAALLNE